MNERIQECWLKAAREDSGEKWDTQEEFIERFAREVIAECCVALHPMLRDMISRTKGVDLIVEHFRVEK
jgi:hypothetical protein